MWTCGFVAPPPISLAERRVSLQLLGRPEIQNVLGFLRLATTHDARDEARQKLGARIALTPDEKCAAQHGFDMSLDFALEPSPECSDCKVKHGAFDHGSHRILHGDGYAEHNGIRTNDAAQIDVSRSAMASEDLTRGTGGRQSRPDIRKPLHGVPDCVGARGGKSGGFENPVAAHEILVVDALAASETFRKRFMSVSNGTRRQR